jgi:pimeloyl-ACP methyl ester carboxylesterase
MLVEIEEEMGWGTTPDDVRPFIPEGGRLDILPGVGHFAHIEDPQGVADRIVGFLGAPA